MSTTLVATFWVAGVLGDLDASNLKVRDGIEKMCSQVDGALISASVSPVWRGNGDQVLDYYITLTFSSEN